MISGGVVGWEKAEDVPCSCLCIMSLYFAYKMIMLGSDTTREVRAGCVGDTSIIIMSAKISIDQVLRNKSRVINNATAEKLQVHLLILIKIFLEIILKLFWTKEYPTVIIPTLQNFVSSLKLHH